MWSDTRFPLPDSVLGPVALDDATKARLAAKARRLVPQLLEWAHGFSDGGVPPEWKQVALKKGFVVHTKPDTSGSGVHALHAALLAPVNVDVIGDGEDFFNALKSTTTADFLATLKRFDPMVLDGKVLAVVQDDPEALCCIKWAAFKTPPVTWDRDLLFLEYCWRGTDSTGRMVAGNAVMSVDMPGMGPLPNSYQCVRAESKISGYLVRDAGNRQIKLDMFSQVDAKGWLPVWVSNLVAVEQAMNLIRVRDWGEDFQRQMDARRAAAPAPIERPDRVDVSGADAARSGAMSSPRGSDVEPDAVHSVADLADHIGLCRRVAVSDANPVYARLELAPRPELAGLESDHPSIHLVPSTVPIVLVMGPSHLAETSNVLAEIQSGVSPTPHHSARLCLSTLCTLGRLRHAASQDPHGVLRLVIFTPKSPSHVFIGTWDNVLAFAGTKYPAIAAVLDKHKPSLKSQTFLQLQEEWQRCQDDSTLTFEAARQRPDLFMSSRRLASLRDPSAADVRLFMYCVLNLGSSFAGDGWLYDDSDTPVSQEWFAQNVALTLGEDCSVARLPCKAILSATAPSRHRPRSRPRVALPPTPAAGQSWPEGSPILTPAPSTGGRGSVLQSAERSGAGVVGGAGGGGGIGGVGGGGGAAAGGVGAAAGDGSSRRTSSRDPPVARVLFADSGGEGVIRGAEATEGVRHVTSSPNRVVVASAVAFGITVAVAAYFKRSNVRMFRS